MLVGMKNRIQDGQPTERVCERMPTDQGELVAQFGEAVLLRIHGRIVLRGGSMMERMEALEWMALTMPEAAPLYHQ
jgi:hypothetical protein